MVNFTVEQIREIMSNSENIRNVTVISHPHHGKSTLTGFRNQKSEITISELSYPRFTDTINDEKECGITITSKGMHMFYEQVFQNTSKKYLINMINSPIKSAFTPEFTSTLRVADGALVLVDSIEGVCDQTEIFLHQALQERVKPVLMINKVDKNLFELQHDAESITCLNSNMMLSLFTRTFA